MADRTIRKYRVVEAAVKRRFRLTQGPYAIGAHAFRAGYELAVQRVEKFLDEWVVWHWGDPSDPKHPSYLAAQQACAKQLRNALQIKRTIPRFEDKSE